MSKMVVTATWSDVPHLSEQDKAELLAGIPPYQRDARSKGVPMLGAGAIYPVPETDVACDPVQLQHWWPRVYALDVGWNRTAGVWAAIDPDAHVTYLYSEHYQGQAEPAVHAAAVRARGEWIPGVIDPAARNRGQRDGEQLLRAYLDLGLNLAKADNAVEAGLLVMWEMMSSGRLKVFRSLSNWFTEFRLYRRDERGHVVKEHDHLMDATRYLVMSGLDRAVVAPDAGQKLVASMAGAQRRVYDPHGGL